MTPEQRAERLKDKRDYLAVLQQKRADNQNRIDQITQDIADLQEVRTGG